MAWYRTTLVRSRRLLLSQFELSLKMRTSRLRFVDATNVAIECILLELCLEGVMQRLLRIRGRLAHRVRTTSSGFAPDACVPSYSEKLKSMVHRLSSIQS